MFSPVKKSIVIILAAMSIISIDITFRAQSILNGFVSVKTTIAVLEQMLT